MSKDKAPEGAALRYVGDGSWLRGVPARDLEPDEVARFDRKALLASGLYTEAAPASAADADSGKESE